VAWQIDIWGSIRRGVAANSALAQASRRNWRMPACCIRRTRRDYFQIQGFDASHQLLDAT